MIVVALRRAKTAAAVPTLAAFIFSASVDFVILTKDAKESNEHLELSITSISCIKIAKRRLIPKLNSVFFANLEPKKR